MIDDNEAARRFVAIILGDRELDFDDLRWLILAVEDDRPDSVLNRLSILIGWGDESTATSSDLSLRPLLNSLLTGAHGPKIRRVVALALIEALTSEERTRPSEVGSDRIQQLASMYDLDPMMVQRFFDRGLHLLAYPETARMIVDLDQVRPMAGPARDLIHRYEGLRRFRRLSGQRAKSELHKKALRRQDKNIILWDLESAS